ncbi:hypothetical protein KVR01_010310 [Diaporthe batatas]|uniref:uncharacterized protein n=1 Tax=Diaporthe batatas TaxID=748121 RepID=UPI001D058E8D|nr:uncharacterized protein KVR01_010310 [Diaporthe batatas]KAG8159673.1 hypothetical protein KVR01_010310 [Diaporthe batatas]
MGLDGDMYEFTDRIMQRSGRDNQKPTQELRGLYRAFAEAVAGEGSRPAQAVQAFEALVLLDKETRSEDDPGRLWNLRSLGNAYRSNGQTKEAVALLKKVVKALEGRGEEDVELTKAQHDLGLAFSQDGQHKEAIAVLEKVVGIQQRTLPAGHRDRLASQHVLAVAYLKDGQIKEATARLEEIQKIQARTLGEDHPETASTQAWLADAYKLAGRLPDAIELCERVVRTRRLFLDEKHPDLLTSHTISPEHITKLRGLPKL